MMSTRNDWHELARPKTSHPQRQNRHDPRHRARPIISSGSNLQYNPDERLPLLRNDELDPR
jgi:hypothetical protein